MVFRAGMLAASLALAATSSGESVEGYLRSSIVHSNRPDRDELVAYLDDCRSVSDKFMRAVVGGDASGAYALLAAPVTDDISPGAFPNVLEDLARRFGRPTAFEYCNQALEFPRGQPRSSVRQSKTWYALTTLNPPTSNLFAVVTSGAESGSCAVWRYDVTTYASEVPSWLSQTEDTPARE